MQCSSQTVTTNKPTSNFLQAGCPSSRPTNSVKALKGKADYTVWQLVVQCIVIGPVCVFVAGGRCPNLTTTSAWAVFASLSAFFIQVMLMLKNKCYICLCDSAVKKIQISAKCWIYLLLTGGGSDTSCSSRSNSAAVSVAIDKFTWSDKTTNYNLTLRKTWLHMVRWAKL